MKKTFRRILSALLIAVMLVGFAPVGGIDLNVKSSAESGSSYKTGDIIEFGSYPQSKVTDSATVSKLDGVTKKWKSYNYYSGTGDTSDGNMKPSDYMKYADIVFNGNKYRAVTFNEYRPRSTGDKSSSDNSDQDNNGYYTDNVYYFKYEPLKWRILDAVSGLIMSDNIIDSQAYQNYTYYNGDSCYNSKDCKKYASDWQTSSLRKWLNEDFYNTAFAKNLQSRILTTHNENKTSYDDGIDTDDRIFVISCHDAVNSNYGFNSDRSAYDPARQMKGTDYAKCQGLMVHDYYNDDYKGNSDWWLRTPDSATSVWGIYYNGFLLAGIRYSPYVYGSDLGVVPALNLDLNSLSYEDKTFNENSYIADIWLSRNREKTPENKAIDSTLSLQSTSATIYDDLKNNKDFQSAVNVWTGMKTVFDPEKGIKDIFLSEEDLYEALIFDLVSKIMYGKNEETGNVIIDAANKASSAVGTVTKYKDYVDKIKTITTVPEKNLLEILKEWKFDPKSESFSKFYGMLSDADQTASKWTDNKFIEGIGTIADVSSDVTDFYKRLTSYIMLEDMSEDTVTLLKTLKSQTQNEKFKTALQNSINAYDNVDTVSLVCTMKLTGDITLDVAGAFFDDLSKCSKLYTALRAGYKVGVALCDITMNTSKTVDAYKTCGATKEFINANKAAINVLAEKYLKSISNSDAGAYVTAVRAYQYAYEIDLKNAVEFVKKASDEGLINKAKKHNVHAFNFFFNQNKQTSYESMVDSEKSITNSMELTFSTLNNTWKFNKDYLYTDYPDVYPVYVKKEISQKQYAPNINSLYIEKSGKTVLTWSIPFIYKGNDGSVQTLWGASTFDGVYATERAGGVTTKYDKVIDGTSNTIEMYNKSTFGSFDKNYTLSAYSNSNSGKVYSASREASLSNPILKPEIRIASAYESGNAQVMFSIVDETSSRYDSIHYLIYRKTNNGSWVKIDEISRENTRFNGRLTLYKDTTAQKGKKYSYKVVSNMVFDNGIALKSPESDAVSVIGGLGLKKVNLNIRKSVPQVRTRSVDEEKYGIDLSWEKAASADGYEIYRVSSYGTVYKLIDTVGSNVTSYTDYDADQGATYSYAVCPYSNSSGKIYDLTEISQGEIEYKVARVHSVEVSDISMEYNTILKLNPKVNADPGVEYSVNFISSDPSVVGIKDGVWLYGNKRWSKKTATVTCVVTDEFGNTVSDTFNVTVGFDWWQWIIGILFFGWIWY